MALWLHTAVKLYQDLLLAQYFLDTRAKQDYLIFDILFFMERLRTHLFHFAISPSQRVRS